MLNSGFSQTSVCNLAADVLSAFVYLKVAESHRADHFTLLS